MRLPEYLNSYIPESYEINNVSDFIFRIVAEADLRSERQINDNQKLILISGLSGAGKTAICNEITRTNESFQKLKTATTRPRRPDEDKENDPYFRFTIEEFKQSLEAGEILEYSEYAGNYYFTRKESITSLINDGINPVIVIDPTGSNFYMQKWIEEDPIVANLKLIRLFVVPPSMETLKERLISRKDSAETIEKRISQSFEDVEHVAEMDFIVVNESDRLNEVVGQVLDIIV